MTDYVFELTGVDHARQGRPVLRDINVCIAAGRPTCLIGSSGSGKTSFLRLLNRLESPQSGTILYQGKDLQSYPVRRLRATIGFAFQAPAIFQGTVGQNLLTAARFSRGRITAEDQTLAMQCLELAELDADFTERDADQLSGGEKQRVALARTLMTRPSVLLLDEPTSALDPDSAKRLVSTLKRLSDSGMTIIMATHRLDEAETLEAECLEFDQGRLIETRPASDLSSSTR